MINYTPHDITVRADDGREFFFPASGVVARVEMVSVPQVATCGGCPTITVKYGDASLPAGETGPCIVSTMFADAYRRQHRFNDVQLFVPDSGPRAIRENGQIVAVRALIRR